MNDLLEQGIEALRSGDKAQAYELLSQATEQAPDDAKAWYYLAGATPNRAERREALQRVLELMPNNEKAREALAQMGAEDAPTTVEDAFEEAISDASDKAEASFEEAIDAASDTADKARKKVIDATDSVTNRLHGTNKPTIQLGESQTFTLPVAIPGAPGKVDSKNLFEEFRTIFMNGIEVLKGNEEAYHAEMRQASWWRFWLFVAIGSVIIAVLSTISGVLIANQVAGAAESLSRGLGVNVQIARPNVFNMLMTLLLTAPISIATMYGGIYAAQWWLTNQRGGNGALFEMAYAIALPVFTANLLTTTLGLIGALLTFISPIVGLVALVIGIVGWWRAVQGIAHVHNVEVQWSAVLAILVYVVASIVIGFALGLILSPFLIASSLSFI